MANDKEAIGELELPHVIADSASQYSLHPCLVDGALRVIFGIYYSSNDALLLRAPFSIDSLSLFKPLDTKCYVYAKFDEQSSGDLSGKIDYYLCNLDNEIAAVIKGFTCRVLQKQVETHDDLFLYQPKWLPENIPSQATRLNACVIYSDDQSDRQPWMSMAQLILWVKPGTHYQQLADDQYQINPSQPADYKKLLSDITQRGIDISHQLHLWNLKNSADMDNQLTNGLYSLLNLYQALDAVAKSNQTINLLYVFDSKTTDSQPVDEAVGSFMKAMKYSKPYWHASSIQFNAASENITQIASRLLNEFGNENNDIRYENNLRLVRRLAPVDSGILSGDNQLSRLKEKGVYLVTGLGWNRVCRRTIFSKAFPCQVSVDGSQTTKP